MSIALSIFLPIVTFLVGIASTSATLGGKMGKILTKLNIYGNKLDKHTAKIDSLRIQVEDNTQVTENLFNGKITKIQDKFEKLNNSVDKLENKVNSLEKLIKKSD